MRRIGLAFGLAAAALPVSTGSAGVAPPAPLPMRVMSTNQCTDQLVLALLPPERIASVTWLSRDPSGSLMVEAAKKVGINHGLAEEVVRQQPDLIVTDRFSKPATRAMLKRLGYPMIEVDDAASFAMIRANVRQVARAVGEVARGEAMIADMDRDLAELARDPGPPLRVVAWDGGGFSAGEGSLYNEVLKAAGAVNIANQPPVSGYNRPDTEVLLVAAPTLLVKGAGVRPEYGMRENIERHPLVRRYWDGARTLAISPAYYTCGTPRITKAAIRLRAELRDAARQIGSPLPFAAGKRP
ncbi:ABC transporter substrate-binding protein [Sphingopyxis sp. PET50]|uniref:ABC transporter substrate-binding protein n=1 Tax=Sphingopyxis sp. PET50 TaxID=2976533 RepID=UPI0021AEB4F5|nr:ABC transporter substrate-binding protein [Sphingopyxis sp. PET50]